MVGIKSLNNASSHINDQRQSIATGDDASQETTNYLLRIGLSTETCLLAMDNCLSGLQTLLKDDQESLWATTSEIYYAHAKALSRTSVCSGILPNTSSGITLSSLPSIAIQKENCLSVFYQDLLNIIRYSYVYLTHTNNAWQYRSFKGRPLQVRDFYNVAVARFVAMQFPLYKQKQISIKTPLVLDNSTIQLNIESDYLKDLPLPEEFVASAFIKIDGLNGVFARDGIGASFVAVLPEKTPPSTPSGSQIVASKYIPLSVVMEIKGKDVKSMLASNDFVIRVFNPFESKDVVLNQSINAPLAANFSAPYALWLARTPLEQVAYKTLLGRGYFEPKMFMLEPYNPRKHIVIFIHGLASSPVTWLKITNDIQGDNRLRDHYQMWQVFYSTNTPILESRLQIKRLIDDTLRQVNYKNGNGQDIILVGHSMGGILTKLLTTKANLTDAALAGLNRSERQLVKLNPEIKARYQIEPLTGVKRAVYIAAPLKGTDYADRWFTLALRKIIGIPGAVAHQFTQSVLTTLTPNLASSLQKQGLLDLQNGPSELSKKSKFMQLTAALPMNPNIPVHTIIGRNSMKGTLESSSDGIVPYSSSHIDNAVSEKVIEGGHSIQETPAAITELRRIFNLHLNTSAAKNSQFVKADAP